MNKQQEITLVPARAVFLQENTLKTDSKTVAEVFGKQHKNVLQAVEALDCSAEFLAANFSAATFDNRGKQYRYYEMTQNGFMFLVMGFTGSQAASIKEAYIKRFDELGETAKAQGHASLPTEHIELQKAHIDLQAKYIELLESRPTRQTASKYTPVDALVRPPRQFNEADYTYCTAATLQELVVQSFPESVVRNLIVHTLSGCVSAYANQPTTIHMVMLMRTVNTLLPKRTVPRLLAAGFADPSDDYPHYAPYTQVYAHEFLRFLDQVVFTKAGMRQAEKSLKLRGQYNLLPLPERLEGFDN